MTRICSRLNLVAMGVGFWLGLVPFLPAWAEALPEVVLRLGMHQVTAEVAAAQKAREQGLMFRPVLPAHRGMLFLFPFADRHCMWMKNTVIPLAVAFLADDGRIVQIEEMAPNTLTAHCAKEPVRWALEMAGGWFRERGVVVGMYVAGLPAKEGH